MMQQQQQQQQTTTVWGGVAPAAAAAGLVVSPSGDEYQFVDGELKAVAGSPGSSANAFEF